MFRRSLRPLVLLTLAALGGCHFDLGRGLAPGEVRGALVYETAEGTRTAAAGATVHLDGSGLRVRADASGRFVMRRLPAGRYTLRIEHDADGNGTIDAGLRLAGLELRDPQADGVDVGVVTIGGLGAIEGTVVTVADPVAQARVVVNLTREQASGADGSFAFTNIVPGTYDVAVVTAAGVVVQPVTVKSREAATLRFDLATGTPVTTGSVVGFARGAGHTFNADIAVSLPQTTVLPFTTRDDGGFGLSDVPAGVYTLQAEKEGFLPAQLPLLVVAGDVETPELVLLPVEDDCGLEGPLGPTADSDGDGHPDSLEPLACRCRPGTLDADLDGLCDDADAHVDSDGDGHGDATDLCPLVPDDQENADEDAFGDACDNCIHAANDDQADRNGDGVGDACEEGGDHDEDGWNDDEDNCPDVYNPEQDDIDEDDTGDACDEGDWDEDGFADFADNCPGTFNPDQEDANENGVGDACETLSPDGDGDGIPDASDNCPQVPNSDQADGDSDGIGDACAPPAPTFDTECSSDGICLERPWPSSDGFTLAVPFGSGAYRLLGTRSITWFDGSTFVRETLPLLPDELLTDLTGLGSGEAWATTDFGRLLHLPSGGSWTVAASESGVTFEGVWSDGGLVFVTSYEGVWTFDGQALTLDADPQLQGASGIRGREGRDVFVSTFGGLRRRSSTGAGGSWASANPSVPGGVVGFDANHGEVVLAQAPSSARTGPSLQIHRWDDQAGAFVEHSVLPSYGLARLRVNEDGSFVALTTGGTSGGARVWRSTGTSWSPFEGWLHGTPVVEPRDVVLSGARGWAFGRGGGLWLFDGATWKSAFDQWAGHAFQSAYSSGPGSLWLVDVRGEPHTESGSGYLPVSAGLDGPVRFITGAGNDRWVAATTGEVFVLAGTAWSRLPAIPGFTGWLSGLHADGNGNLFAYGAAFDPQLGLAGQVWRFAAGTWSSMSHPFNAPIVGLHGPATNVWAASEAGEVAKWDGSGWSVAQQLPGGGAPTAVWAGNVAAAVVGTNASFWRGGDQPWTNVAGTVTTPHFVSDLRAVYGLEFTRNGTATVEVFGVGHEGLMFAAKGSSGAPAEQLPSLTGGSLVAMTGAGGAGLVAVGDALLRWNGGDWQSWLPAYGAGQALSSLYVATTLDVFAVGERGLVMRRDSSSGMWIPSETGVASNLTALHGTGGSDVWAVGAMNAAVHFDGTRWTRIAGGIHDDLVTVWAESPTRAWAASAGLLYRWDGGTSWTVVPLGQLNSQGIRDVASAGGVTLVVGPGLLARIDGQGVARSEGALSSSAIANAVHVLDDGSALVVGDAGGIWRRSAAGAWTTETVPATSVGLAAFNLFDVWSDGDVSWAVGVGSVAGLEAQEPVTLRRSSTGAWTRLRMPGVNAPVSVSGVGDAVWAVGGNHVWRVSEGHDE